MFNNAIRRVNFEQNFQKMCQLTIIFTTSFTPTIPDTRVQSDISSHIPPVLGVKPGHIKNPKKLKNLRFTQDELNWNNKFSLRKKVEIVRLKGIKASNLTF